MSTKNLSRTVIEGGRCEHYKCEVAEYKTKERAASRNYLRQVETDPEFADEDLGPARKPVSPCFADKIRPTNRFLDANVGRPWSEVKSELHAKFDSRTTPGRHVLYDHIFYDVSTDRTNNIHDYRRWYVDDHGILRRRPRERYHGPRQPLWNPRETLRWLDGRRIGRCGERLRWLLPPRRVDVRALWGPRSYPCGLKVSRLAYVLHDHGKPVLRTVEAPGMKVIVSRTYYSCGTFEERCLPASAYHFGTLLTKTEEAFFRGLPEVAQKEILGEAGWHQMSF